MGDAPTDATAAVEAPADRPRVVKTHAMVAEEFGVSRHTVSQDWAQVGMPGQRGRYDLVEIAKWLRTRPGMQQQTASAEKNEAAQRRLLAEARLKEADADRRELRNGRERGDFIERAEVEAIWAEMIVEVRTQAERIAERMKPQFPSKLRADLTAELQRQVEVFLVTMAEWRPALDMVAGTGRPMTVATDGTD